MSKPIVTITDEECEKLLKYLKYHPVKTGHRPRYHRNYTMALVMLDAGLRVNELVKLKRNCLIFAGEFLENVVVPSDIAKNKVERVVPMSERLKKAVIDMQMNYWTHDETPGTGFAFYTWDTKAPMTARQVQRNIKAAALASIGRAIHPHILRHTFATRLMRKTSMRIVQQLLGHKSIQSTQIYTHPNSTDLKEAIDSLEATP